MASVKLPDVAVDTGESFCSDGVATSCNPSARALVLNPIYPTLSSITVYTTRSRLYIIGCSEEPPGGPTAIYRVLKIDRTVDKRLEITDDAVNYTQKQVQELLLMIDAVSGEKNLLDNYVSAYGILGFIKFLAGYYLILITKRRKVMQIGMHYVFKIEDTMMLPIFSQQRKATTSPLESRYVRAFQNVDISSNFYYSYTYDCTRPLQQNMHVPSSDEEAGLETPTPRVINPNRSFVWNNYLIQAFNDDNNAHAPWALFVIHGFVAQSCLSVFGKSIYVGLIARRSWEFAGTRFLKRGANCNGEPANNVETEQIVFDASECNHGSGKFTSYLQLRASIPCFWSQDVAATKIKPPVNIDRRDPFACAAGKHFNLIAKKYGAPIIVLNLVKRKEKRPRESILADELSRAIAYLNQFLDEDKRISHIMWDMHRTAKSRDGNVLRTLNEIGVRGMTQVGFFHAGPDLHCNRLRTPNTTVGGVPYGAGFPGRNQTGIVRVNCVDCLDRTNTAQFMFGFNALGHQLYALGVLESPTQLTFDCDAFHLLEEMYEDQGDTLALQYGGSQLVNRIQTYRKTSPWTVGSRDILNTVTRYYSNSFTDAEKQEAINLFLGRFVPNEEEDTIWKLESDLFLHFPHLKHSRREPLGPYVEWCGLTHPRASEINHFSGCLEKMPYAGLVSPQRRSPVLLEHASSNTAPGNATTHSATDNSKDKRLANSGASSDGTGKDNTIPNRSGHIDDNREANSASSSVHMARGGAAEAKGAPKRRLDFAPRVDRAASDAFVRSFGRRESDDFVASFTAEKDDSTADNTTDNTTNAMAHAVRVQLARHLLPLPSLQVFRCHDIVLLKQRILEFYRIGTGIRDRAELGFKAPSPRTTGQIADLLSFLYGESVLPLEAVAQSTSTSVLASILKQLSHAKNCFAVLNPAAARLDYIAIRNLLVDRLGISCGKFDREVKQLVGTWKTENKSPEDYNIAALLVASRHGCHFIPTTQMPPVPPSIFPRPPKRANPMYEQFYNTHKLTVFSELYPSNMVSTARLSGSPFAPSSHSSGLSGDLVQENLFQSSPFGKGDRDGEEGDSDQDDADDAAGATTAPPTPTVQNDGSGQVHSALPSALDPKRAPSSISHGSGGGGGGSSSKDWKKSPVLPSAETVYGITIVLPKGKDMTQFEQHVEMNGFLDGHDYFHTSPLTTAQHRTPTQHADNRRGGAAGNLAAKHWSKYTGRAPTSPLVARKDVTDATMTSLATPTVRTRRASGSSGGSATLSPSDAGSQPSQHASSGVKLRKRDYVPVKTSLKEKALRAERNATRIRERVDWNIYSPFDKVPSEMLYKKFVQMPW